MLNEVVLSVNDLSVEINQKTLIDRISFDVYKNEIVGIVGESGSGKSLTSLAIMGLLPKLAKASGMILFQQKDISNLSFADLKNIRGNHISMVFQEPMTSLNPSMKCGKQVAEMFFRHTNLPKNKVKKRVLTLFEQVKLPDVERIYHSYPHQISGGQKQRVMIAMAIACNPKILIADEPTTALDIQVQKEIITLLKEIQQQTQMSIIFISHDISLVSQIADRLIVMRYGKLIETGTKSQIFGNPQQAYTKALLHLSCLGDIRLKRLPTIHNYINNTFDNQFVTKEERQQNHRHIYQKSPILQIDNLTKEYASSVGFFSKTKVTKVLKGVSLSVYQGETIGIVGESGCGKTTLGRTIIQLEKPSSGNIFYQGQSINKMQSFDNHRFKKDVQLIFQDPYSSLNPTIRVGEAIAEPMKVHRLYQNDNQRKEKVFELLHNVGLTTSDYYKYPHEFSGGQRQRIGIARAIALNPKIVICDESVSALDISVQAQVLNLLNELKSIYKLTYIFISHDLSVVKYMSDRIAIMNNGKIEELGEADEVFTNPKKEYTKRFLANNSHILK